MQITLITCCKQLQIGTISELLPVIDSLAQPHFCAASLWALGGREETPHANPPSKRAPAMFSSQCFFKAERDRGRHRVGGFVNACLQVAGTTWTLPQLSVHG